MRRRPADREIGRHLFKGFRYDNNGNPLYTCDTLSNEEAQAMGWRFSPKYGLYGQLTDPTMFAESKNHSIRLTESELKRIITESVKNILKEDLFPDGIDITPARTAWEGILKDIGNEDVEDCTHEARETLLAISTFELIVTIGAYISMCTSTERTNRGF